MGTTDQMTVYEVAEYLNSTLIQILALEESLDTYKVVIVDIHSLANYEKKSNKFTVLQQNKFDSLSDSKIVLTEKFRTANNDIILLTSLFKVFYKLNINEISINQLCLALSMDKEFTTIPKPVRVKELKPLIERFTRFIISEDTVRIRKVEEMLNDVSSEDFVRFDKIPSYWIGEGLMVFKFIGEEFPIEEAREYVEIRPIVYLNLEKQFSFENLQNFSAHYSELAKAIYVLTPKSDTDKWATENLRVFFLNDNYEHLMVIFDSLLKNYSPVFNIQKNPGNLFRSFIEDKIKKGG